MTQITKESCFSTNIIYYISLTIYCLVISLLVIAFLIIIPFFEIYFGYKYGDEIICQPQPQSVSISIKYWLIIKGCVSVIGVISVLIMLLCLGSKSLLYYILNVITNLFIFFNLVWVITGSVIFWVDCNNLYPKEINILMYISLIYGYISFLNFIAISNKYIDYDNKRQRPLLEV